MKGYFEKELEERLTLTGKIISSNLNIYFIGKEKNFEEGKYLNYLREKLKKNKEELNLERLYIFNLKGEAIVDTENLTKGTLLSNFLLNPVSLDNLKKGIVYSTLLYEIKGEYFKSCFIPIKIGDEFLLGLGIDAPAEYVKNFKVLQLKIFYFFLISLLFGLVVSFYLSKSISKPLKNLIKETENLIKSDFEKPLTFNSRTELDKIGNTLEILRQNINKRDEYLKMMVSQIAHEIKNPLSIFNFYLSFLLDENINAEERKNYVNILKEETEKIEGLLDNFINFVKKKEPKFEIFNLKDLFSKIEKLYSKKAKENNINFMIDISENLKIFSDKDFLFHILFNLVKNSFEAMEEGGKLEMIGIEEEKNFKIVVKDTGCGIKEEIKDKVFEPFFTTKAKGIGLGLTVVKEYTKKLKGNLIINSKEGKGTEVIILFKKRRENGYINN